MNETLIKLTLFLFLVFQIELVAQENNKKLPVPDKAFLESIKNSENAEIEYFNKYFGKISKPKVLKRFIESKDVCKIVYLFKNGIVYTKDECSESGADVTIIFPNYSKSELTKYVEWFFKSDWNIWNKDKSLYQPKEDGDAGCYIEIKQNKNGYYIKYYCGC